VLTSFRSAWKTGKRFQPHRVWWSRLKFAWVVDCLDPASTLHNRLRTARGRERLGACHTCPDGHAHLRRHPGLLHDTRDEWIIMVCWGLNLGLVKGSQGWSRAVQRYGVILLCRREARRQPPCKCRPSSSGMRNEFALRRRPRRPTRPSTPSTRAARWWTRSATWWACQRPSSPTRAR
jgi:hypothetical protein